MYLQILYPLYYYRATRYWKLPLCVLHLYEVNCTRCYFAHSKRFNCIIRVSYHSWKQICTVFATTDFVIARIYHIYRLFSRKKYCSPFFDEHDDESNVPTPGYTSLRTISYTANGSERGRNGTRGNKPPRPVIIT